MKTTLKKEQGIILLPRNSKLQADSLYFILSESSAKTLYFQKKVNIEGMHVKIKQHMLPVLDVLDYMFVGKGLLLMVRTKSEEEIKAYYERIQRLKKKMMRFDEASQILSEQIRLALSTSAKRTNRQNRRSGSLVHSNFDRALIEDIGSAEQILEKMRERAIKLCRQGRQYRADIRNWNRDKMLKGDGDVYLCTKKWLDREARKAEREANRNSLFFDLEGISYDVLQTLIKSTLSNHCLAPSSQKPTNSS